MVIYRWAKPEDEADLLDFANYVFSLSSMPTDFKKLQPRVYDRNGFFAITASAMENGRVKGMISYDSRDLLLTKNENLRYGFIGTVCVHPYHRGQGHMSTLMSMVVDRLKNEGCQIAILQGRRQRYQHFGFENAGEMLGLHFNTDSLRHSLGSKPAQEIKIIDLQEAGEEALFLAMKMHSSLSMFSKRKPEDFLMSLQTNQGRGYAVFKNRKPQGYFSFSLNWMGELCLLNPQDAPNVIAAFSAYIGKQPVKLMIRPFELPNLQALVPAVVYWERFPFGMIKVLEWAGFLQGMLRFKASIDELVPEQKVLGIKGEGNYLIDVSAGDVSVQATVRPADLMLDAQAAVCLAASGLSRELFPHHPFLNWFPVPFGLLNADLF